MKSATHRSAAQSVLDDRTLDNVSDVLFNESKRGLEGAAARLDQTRTDVFNKLRELEGELDSRKPADIPADRIQVQVAYTLIAHLAKDFAHIVESDKGNESKMAEVHRIFGIFEHKLGKVLDVMSSLQESIIDVQPITPSES